MNAPRRRSQGDPGRAMTPWIRRHLSWMTVVALGCAVGASTLGQLIRAPGVAPYDQDLPLVVRRGQAAMVLGQRLEALRPHLRLLSLDRHEPIGLAFLDDVDLRPASEAYHRVASRALAPYRLTRQLHEAVLIIDAGPRSAGALPAAASPTSQPWTLLAQTDDGLHLVRRAEP